MFPCTGCGLCCQNISTVDELKSFDLGNGVCKYFDNLKNECIIYDKRPDICKVEKMFELKYQDFFTKEAFYIENANICNMLQKQYGIDEIFKVKIGD